MTTRARASAGNGRGAVRAGGVDESRALPGGSPQARLADAGRLSPLPAGRWLLAVTQASGTALGRSVRVTRPTVPTILSPWKNAV